MKKSALPAALLLLGVALSGCPVYDSTDNGAYGCYSDFDCPSGYVCDGTTLTCFSVGSASNACKRPIDCGTNETCSRSGTCASGDCHFASVGCVDGYECSPDSGTWQCVKQGSGTGAGGTSAGGAGDENAGAAPGGAGSPSMSSGGAPEPANAAGAGG
jgi:hypothetical protein